MIHTSIHLNGTDFECVLNWCKHLETGDNVASVHIDGCTIYFDSVDQIDRVQAVLAEARKALAALIGQQPGTVEPVPEVDQDVTGQQESDTERARQ